MADLTILALFALCLLGSALLMLGSVFLVLYLLAAFMHPVYLLLFRRKKRSHPQRQRNVNPKLRAQLLSLLSGDQAAAERMVNLARAMHPQRPETWYWEKAIHDLIRDRR